MTHVALHPIHGIALCAGVGMLDEGLRLGLEHLGFEYRPAAYVERETFAAAQLVALMEAGCLDQAPIWSDLCTFDAQAWRGRVDCVTAGFPCQPHSVAGKREGLDDERWIWPDIARIVRDSGAWLVYLENVPGLATTGGLAAVLADLAAIGFDAEVGILSAADVGASQQRERLFILGWLANNNNGREVIGLGELLDRFRTPRGDDADGCGADVADARRRTLCRIKSQSIGRSGDETGADDGLAAMENPARHERLGSLGEGGRRRGVREAGDELGNATILGRRERRTELSRRERRSDIAGTGGELGLADDAHAQGGGYSGDEEGRQEPIGHARLAERGLFAPGPLDARWAGIVADYPHLAPATEPGVRMLADGLAYLVDESRTDQLRAIGNGVVPLTAAAAFVLLARRAGLNIFY